MTAQGFKDFSKSKSAHLWLKWGSASQLLVTSTLVRLFQFYHLQPNFVTQSFRGKETLLWPSLSPYVQFTVTVLAQLLSGWAVRVLSHADPRGLEPNGCSSREAAFRTVSLRAKLHAENFIIPLREAQTSSETFLAVCLGASAAKLKIVVWCHRRNC